MKKKLWLVFLIGSQLIFSQKNFTSGYIIDNSNTKIEGEIAVKNKNAAFNEITFKSDNSIQTFSSKDILEYGYEGNVYRSKNQMNYFIKLVIEGELSLYEGPEWYYLEKEDQVYKLETSEYEAEVLGEKVMVKDNKWRGIVSNLILDCTNHSTSVAQGIQLSKNSLIGLVDAYNDCRENGGNKSSNLGKSYKPKTKFNIGIASNISNNKLELINSNHTSPSNYDPNQQNLTSTSPSFGLSMEFISPSLSENFAVMTEVYYSDNAYAFQLNSEPNRYEENQINISKIAVPFSFKYIAPKYIKGVYVQLGINFDFHMNSNFTQRIETVNNNVILTEYDDGKLEFSSLQEGYWAGVGYEYSFKKVKLNVGLRYSKLASNDVDSAYYDLHSTGTSLNLTLFYI